MDSHRSTNPSMNTGKSIPMLTSSELQRLIGDFHDVPAQHVVFAYVDFAPHRASDGGSLGLRTSSGDMIAIGFDARRLVSFVVLELDGDIELDRRRGLTSEALRRALGYPNAGIVNVDSAPVVRWLRFLAADGSWLGVGLSRGRQVSRLFLGDQQRLAAVARAV